MIALFPSKRWSALVLSLVFACTTWAAPPDGWFYTVTPGDTLSGIAQTHLDRPDAWRELQKVNKVADPDLLLPGARLLIPYSLGGGTGVFAEVVWMRGDVQQISGTSKTATTLRAGDQLKMGDIVKTIGNSSVTLKFADQSRLLLSADSHLVLTQMIRNRQTSEIYTQAFLAAGSAESTVTKRQKANAHYIVKTPALNLAVRGTVFRVSVDPQTGFTRTAVDEGAVSATGKGDDVAVTAGLGTSALPGRVPSAPAALLMAPGLKAAQPTVNMLPLSFTWSPVAQATAYRVELMDQDGVGQAEQITVTEPRSDMPVVADGKYQIRVRAVDPGGMEGNAMTHAFVLKGHPEPPMVRYPLGGAVVQSEVTNFRWARPLGIQNYRFQVSKVADFSSVVTEVRQLNGNSVGIDVPLPAGQYFWRVAAVTRQDGIGPYSDVQSFEVQALAASAAKPIEAVGAIDLRWLKGSNGQKYQVQAASEPEFKSVWFDTTQIEPTARITSTTKGAVYVRLRRIESNGVAGLFEATQLINTGESL